MRRGARRRRRALVGEAPMNHCSSVLDALMARQPSGNCRRPSPRRAAAARRSALWRPTEGPKRLQPRNRIGAVLGLRDADMDERVIAQSQAEIPDILPLGRAQFLKHRLDQALVLVRRLRLGPVAAPRSFSSKPPLAACSGWSPPEDVSKRPKDLRQTKLSRTESFSWPRSSSWRESPHLRRARRRLAMTRRNEKSE